MFYDEPDMAGYAQRAKPIAAPGTRWSYSSASTHLVSRIVRDAVGGAAPNGADAVQRFAFAELFDPLGMRNVTFETDATGTPIGAHYLFASARDWARFGSLFLNDGVVGGRRLLPEGWVQWSTTPTLGTQYGAGWWTNRGDDEAVQHRRRLGIPADALFANGNLGQRIAVIPSEQLVIVRMARAHTKYNDQAGFERLIVDTIAALHAGR
jgi:CubicO group peptidase (beta-lactamase class C family)